MKTETIKLTEDQRRCMYDHLRFMRCMASDWESYRKRTYKSESLIRRECGRIVIALVRGSIALETGVLV